MRLDKYLKISRLIKRRTVANEACDNGRTSSVIFLRRNLQFRRRRGKPEVFPGIPASEPAAAQVDRNSELFLNYWRTALTEPEKEG